MAETKFLDSVGLTHLLEKTNAKFSKLGHTHTKAQISDFAHTHDDRYYTETEIDSKLGGKSNTGHNHDDRYYTESEINSKLAGKSDTSHSHTTHLTTDIAASADLNTITTAGWYKCPMSATAAGLKNCPTKIAFAMEVLINAGVTQKLYEYDSSVPKVYIRNYHYGAWGEWKRVYTTADKPTAGEIGAAAASHTHTKAQISDFPTSMPASDVYAWAKAPTKPSYTKGEVGLGNVDNTADSAKSVKYATSATANNPIKTTGTGAAYAAIVDGITALTIGVKFTMVPHVTSTTTAPTLNVSSLGAKSIRMRLTSSTTATIQLTSASFLTANKPVNVTYDGTYWVIDDFAQPDVNSLYGTVPISKGGTGATTAAKALANLGAMPKAEVQAHIANTTIHITAAERAKWNAKADITIGTAEPTSSTSGIFYIQTN